MIIFFIFTSYFIVSVAKAHAKDIEEKILESEDRIIAAIERK